jgi:hypothetical protein
VGDRTANRLAAIAIAITALTAYFGFALAEVIPPGVNAICLRDSWSDHYQSCNTLLDPAPRCEDLTPKRMVREHKPHRFVQLYWRGLSCAATDRSFINAAWAFQTDAYRADNSPGGFSQFEGWVARHADFEVEAASDVKSRRGRSIVTASVKIQLLYRDRIKNGDLETCRIAYVLEERQAQLEGIQELEPTWAIAETKTDDKC